MKNELLNVSKNATKTFYSIKHYSQCTNQGRMFKLWQHAYQQKASCLVQSCTKQA